MKRRPRGFTLLEVMVALSILAIGLAAAFRAVGATTHTVSALQARQLADWVAQNQLAMLRAMRARPPVGETGGEWVMDGQRFVWRMRVSPFGQSSFHRVDLAVFVAGDRDSEPLARLVGFLAPP